MLETALAVGTPGRKSLQGQLREQGASGPWGGRGAARRSPRGHVLSMTSSNRAVRRKRNQGPSPGEPRVDTDRRTDKPWLRQLVERGLRCLSFSVATRCQPSREAGMKVVLSPPSGPKTQSVARWGGLRDLPSVTAPTHPNDFHSSGSPLTLLSKELRLVGAPTGTTFLSTPSPDTKL